MARVTVEDCILQIPNRFELVMKAAQRSRALSVGAELTVERDNDKNPVVALREIADETVDIAEIEESLVKGLQKHVAMDEPVEEGEDTLAADRAFSEFAAMGLVTGPAERDAADEEDPGPDMAGFEDIDEDEAAAEDDAPPEC